MISDVINNQVNNSVKRTTHQFQLSDAEYAVVMQQPGATKSDKLRHLLINNSVNNSINNQVNNHVIDKPIKSNKLDKKDVLKTLRDSLRSCKKVSPIKTELVAVLTAILKDGPTEEEAELPALVPLPVVSDDDDGSIDPYIVERIERKRTDDAKTGLQPIGGTAVKRSTAESIARLSGKTLEEARMMLTNQPLPQADRQDETVQDEASRYDAPEPTEEDWHPDEDDHIYEADM